MAKPLKTNKKTSATMNKRVKKQWLKALRSGSYKQTIGALKRKEWETERFCSLGVLFDVFLKSKAGEDYKWEPSNSCLDGVYFYGLGPEARDKVRKWCGINPSNESISKKYNRCVIEYNDYKRFSFKKIANLIEKNL